MGTAGKPGVNPAHKLMSKLQENRHSLHIARVPDKAKEAFIALANKEFCGDYGFCLKWLMDDVLSQDTRAIISKLEEHEARIQGLEAGAYRKIENQVEAEPEVKGKKMLDGKIKRIGGIEK